MHVQIRVCSRTAAERCRADVLDGERAAGAARWRAARRRRGGRSSLCTRRCPSADLSAVVAGLVSRRAQNPRRRALPARHSESARRRLPVHARACCGDKRQLACGCRPCAGRDRRACNMRPPRAAGVPPRPPAARAVRPLPAPPSAAALPQRAARPRRTRPPAPARAAAPARPAARAAGPPARSPPAAAPPAVRPQPSPARRRAPGPRWLSRMGCLSVLVSAAQSAGAVILACIERGGGSADASARRMSDLTGLWTSLRSASGVSPSGRHGARRCMQEEGVLRARLLERQLAAAQARLHRPAQLVGLGGRHGVRGAQPLQAQAARQPQHQRAAAGRAGILAPRLLRPTAQRVSVPGAALTGRTCRSAVMLSTSPCRLTRAAEGTPAVAPPGHCSMAPVALATLSLAHRLSYSSQNLVCAGVPTGLSQAGRSGRPAAWQHPDLGLCNPTSATNQANNLVSQRLASKGDDSELASLRRSPQPKNMAVLHHVGLPGTHLWSSTARPLPAVLPALAHALSCAELPACAHAPPSALGWSSALLRAAIDEHTSGGHVCMQAQDLEMLCALGSDGLHRTSASWG